MVDAHKGLNLDDTYFDIVVSHLCETFVDLGIG